MIAYHEARARGGAGLIISEIVAVHPSAAFSGQLLSALDPGSIDAYAELASACHRHECQLFAQLFHPGREILSTLSGHAPIAYAPSAVPNERFHIMPKPMSNALIREIIDGYADSAANLASAGVDGVEIVASHGYLPAQFLSPVSNRRDDEYGGDSDRRLQFLRDCIAAVRARAPTLALGVRLSIDDGEEGGLDAAATLELASTLEPTIDYLSLVTGSSASLGASVHVVPPMGLETGYLAPASATIREQLDIPVIVTGRINQPQDAEQIIASGQADLCGMTRALICDPELPVKTANGQIEDIRACIACNQSCIGRAHKGLAISCIQNPRAGRELEIPALSSSENPGSILVVGAGPAGLRFAIDASACGHRVILCERSAHAGGQIGLAQQLPGREEFGGLLTNLLHELEQSTVDLRCNTEVDLALIEALSPDRVVLATGASPYPGEFEMLDRERSPSYASVLRGEARVGNRVIVADWRGDWIGVGLAEKLARDGCQVSLMVNGPMVGESLQIYTRNYYVARLYELGVDMVTHARLFGSDADSVYFQNTLTDEPMVYEGIDSLVLSLGQRACSELEETLLAAGIDAITIGDCRLPRTAEEAIYEATTLARSI